MMKHSSRQSEKFSRIGACIRRNFTPCNKTVTCTLGSSHVTWEDPKVHVTVHVTVHVISILSDPP